MKKFSKIVKTVTKHSNANKAILADIVSIELNYAIKHSYIK